MVYILFNEEQMILVGQHQDLLRNGFKKNNWSPKKIMTGNR